MIGPRLKDLGRWFSGGTPPSEHAEYWDGDVPWLSGKDFDKTVLRDPTKFTTEEGAALHSRLVPGGQTVLVLVRGMALAHGLPVARLPFDAAINQDVRGLVLRQRFDPGFAHYALVGRRAELNAHIDRAAHGTARLLETVYSHRIAWMPELAAQRTIADFLDRECERVAACWRGSSELQTAALAANAEGWAFRLLDCQGRTDRLKFLVYAPVRGVWGGDAGSGQVDVACARVADFDREALVVAPPKTVRSISDRDLERLKLEAGDLLLETSGGGARSPVGFVVRYTTHQRAHVVVTSNFVARLRPRPCNDSLYLSHLFAALYRTRRNAAFIKQNTGIQNLDIGAYLSLPVPGRALHEQVALGKEAEASLTAALQVRVQGANLNVALERYRSSLIHEAVTGKLDITVVSDRQMDERLQAATEDRLDEVAV